MIKPRELESGKGRDIWDTIMAATACDMPTLLRLLERDPSLSQAEYWIYAADSLPSYDRGKCEVKSFLTSLTPSRLEHRFTHEVATLPT